MFIQRLELVIFVDRELKKAKRKVTLDYTGPLRTSIVVVLDAVIFQFFDISTEFDCRNIINSPWITGFVWVLDYMVV